MLVKNNISLRSPELGDVDFLFQMENDQRLWHLSNTLTPFSRFDLEQFVMLPDKDIFVTKQVRFIIERLENDTKHPIGAIDLFNFEPQHKRAGLGIMLIEEERQKGFAGVSLDLIVEYAFTVLDLHQLYCNIEASNKSSFSLFRNKGFVETGIKKEWNLRNGKWVDEHLLQLINPG